MATQTGPRRCTFRKPRFSTGTEDGLRCDAESFGAFGRSARIVVMRAYEVLMNGKPLCTAGTPDGIVTLTIADVNENTTLYIGASESSNGESVTWIHTSLKAGDEVRVRVVESESVDEPAARHCQETLILDERKKYVRAWARRFGWTLTESEPS